MKRFRIIAAILLVCVCALVLLTNCTNNGGYYSKVMQKKHNKFNSYQHH